MFHDVQGLIFDFDGTLIDSLTLWKEVDVEFLEERGFHCPDDLQQEIEGMSLSDCATYFQKRFGLEESHESMIAQWMRIVRRKYLSLPWKEGSEDFLHYAKDAQYPLAVATSNQEELVADVLRHRQLDQIFSTITTSDQVGVSKPEPKVFLEAARRIGISAEKCLVFEDTYAGLEGARRAGMRTVAVFNEHFGNWDELRAHADHFIVDYHLALELLRRKHE